MGLAGFIHRMPKVELHIHLEGSIRPATLLRLAARRGVELPASDEAGLQRWFAFRDFDHFVEIYLTCSRCLVEPEDFALVALDLMAEQARQNVVHTEAHFTISTHLANGVDGRQVAEALQQAIREGEERFGVGLRLIPDIVRNVGRGPAERTLEWALDQDDSLVTAMGLAGSEEFPNREFFELFDAAARAGLHCVAHAGEHGGPDSIRSVLDHCHAERIGHGIAAVRDPGLMAELARRAVPLEVCPTSNICLGVSRDAASHPFDELRRAGLVVTVNSDDPPFFDTTLVGEYELLASSFGYGAPELAGLSLTALATSFLPRARKLELETRFMGEIAALGVELLGESVEPVYAVETAET